MDSLLLLNYSHLGGLSELCLPTYSRHCLLEVSRGSQEHPLPCAYFQLGLLTDAMGLNQKARKDPGFLAWNPRSWTLQPPTDGIQVTRHRVGVLKCKTEIIFPESPKQRDFWTQNSTNCGFVYRYTLKCHVRCDLSMRTWYPQV